MDAVSLAGGAGLSPRSAESVGGSHRPSHPTTFPPPFFPSSHQAHAALRRQEVPVGCVLVDTASGEVVATGSNRTNEMRNVSKEKTAGPRLFTTF